MTFNMQIKHHKIKNTGLLFEFLVRQLTVDVLNKVDDSPSLRMIKKRFSENTELGKEFQLYNILLTKKFKSDKKADFFITETLNMSSKINRQKLRREKYNLINDINNNYNLNDLMSSRIDNYKLYASIYKLFESNEGMSPYDRTEIYFTLVEHVTDVSSVDDIKLSSISKYNTLLNDDADVRILSYRILLEKFNNKYKSLDNNQRDLLKAYINNISNVNSLKEYINGKIPSLKKELKHHSKSVTDQVVKIKLKESIHSIDKFCKINNKVNNVKDSAVIQLMRYYELLKELKKQ